MKLLVITHAPHRCQDSMYFAYPPYVREMDLWLKQVEQAEIIAPREKVSKGRPYSTRNIKLVSVPNFNITSLKSIFFTIFAVPVVVIEVFLAMKRADHLHLRCPGNMGLLACLCQVFFPSKPKTAKYAGNWDPQAKQPWTYKLQKWILSNVFLTRNIQVLVYGEWPEQSKNVQPFFTASFTEKVVEEVKNKSFKGTLTLLFVGNLVPGKRPLKAVQLVQELQQRLGRSREAPEVRLQIYGDGPEREMLEAYCRNENLMDLVHFKGRRTLEELKEAYQVAHFVILPSESEGWPKAIAEGMFFGCIPIASPVSCIPWMLGSGSRGILLRENQKAGNKNEDYGKDWSVVRGQLSVNLEKICSLLENPEEMQRMSDEAKEWSQEYTLEKFEEAIKGVLLNPNEEKFIAGGKL